eukprot:1333092-Rhodomonas_salina.2
MLGMQTERAGIVAWRSVHGSVLSTCVARKRAHRGTDSRHVLQSKQPQRHLPEMPASGAGINLTRVAPFLALAAVYVYLQLSVPLQK